MTGDAAVDALLGEIVVDWTDAGVLGELCQLVRTVWRTNVDRYEPTRLGDDAMSLGVQSSRNVCNLAVRRLAATPDVRARDTKTLEIEYSGRTLHTGKIPSRSRSWEVSSVNWSVSEVRTSSAEINSKVYLPVSGTLFDGSAALPGQPVNPRALRRLMMVWQGFDDGSTRSWLGFPRLGDDPWFGVRLIDDGSGGRGSVPAADRTPAPPAPDFDSMREPTVDLVRRRSPAKRPSS